jgi:hypothetical protein
MQWTFLGARERMTLCRRFEGVALKPAPLAPGLSPQPRNPSPSDGPNLSATAIDRSPPEKKADGPAAPARQRSERDGKINSERRQTGYRDISTSDGDLLASVAADARAWCMIRPVRVYSSESFVQL